MDDYCFDNPKIGKINQYNMKSKKKAGFLRLFLLKG